MPDKYKALRDALAEDSLTLRHIAVAEDGVCRFMTGRKLPPHLDSVELHGIDSGRGVFDSVAVPKETIRNLLAERDQLLQALSGLVDDVEGLISESYGVTGLHLNGDVADWEELLPSGAYERLTHLDIAKEAIASATGEPHD